MPHYFLCYLQLSLVLVALLVQDVVVGAWLAPTTVLHRTSSSCFLALDRFLENDLVAVKLSSDPNAPQRLCAVKPDLSVYPLCQHEDDVETDLFVDPTVLSEDIWDEVTDDLVCKCYGEGWYGQRPVPSLGGGPGYGAEADEIWSVDPEVLEQVRADGVLLPILDVGISHGEKARGGAY